MATTLSAAHGLALLRAGFGVYFLASAYDKTTKGWLTAETPLERTLRQSLPHAVPWYGQFLQTTVIPHASFFAQLVTIGEWAVGLSLLLGFFTPVGALAGIWLNANYMLMKGLPNVAGSIDRVFIVSELVILVTGAGIVWGLDGVLGRALPQRGRQRTLLHPAGRRNLVR